MRSHIWGLNDCPQMWRIQTVSNSRKEEDSPLRGNAETTTMNNYSSPKNRNAISGLGSFASAVLSKGAVFRSEFRERGDHTNLMGFWVLPQQPRSSRRHEPAVITEGERRELLLLSFYVFCFFSWNRRWRSFHSQEPQTETILKKKTNCWFHENPKWVFVNLWCWVQTKTDG